MIEHINNLKEDEIYQFEKFIISPYFNSNRNLIILFGYLKNKYPCITEEDITKEKLSMIVYEEDKVNDAKIRKLISDFSQVFEKFVMQNEFERNSISNKVLLLQGLRRRCLFKRFDCRFSELYESQRRKFSKDSEYYHNQINIENEVYYYDFSKYKLEYANCLQNKSDNIDFLFLFYKLHNFYEMIQNKINRGPSSQDFKMNFHADIISFVETNIQKIKKKHPNIFIIYSVLMMWNTNKDEYLVQIMNYLNLNGRKFTKENLSYYYNYIVSYYMHRINQGKIEFRKKVFELFKMMREKKLFLIDNMITDTEFNNVINVSLALNEFKWAAGFIEEYGKYLDASFRKDSYSMARAKLYFHQKDYENIFSFLKEIEFKDPVYYINSKFLLAKVYFETRNIDSSSYIAENLKQYTRDKKTLTTEQVKIIKTFATYLTHLIRIYESPVKKKKSLAVIMKKELENEKSFVPTKNWFYEKLSEF